MEIRSLFLLIAVALGAQLFFGIAFSNAHAAFDVPERPPFDEQLYGLRQERLNKIYHAAWGGDEKGLAELINAETADLEEFPVPGIWDRELTPGIREVLIRGELERAARNRNPFSADLPRDVIAGREVIRKLVVGLPKDLSDQQHTEAVHRQIDLTTSVLWMRRTWNTPAPPWLDTKKYTKKQYRIQIQHALEDLTRRMSKSLLHIKELEDQLEAQRLTGGGYRGGAVTERLEAELAKELRTLHLVETELMLYSELARMREFSDIKNILDRTLLLSVTLPGLGFLYSTHSALVAEVQVISTITHIFGGLLYIRLNEKYGNTQVEKNYWSAMEKSAAAAGVSLQVLQSLLEKYSCSVRGGKPSGKFFNKESQPVKKRIAVTEEPEVRARVEAEDGTEWGELIPDEFHSDPVAAPQKKMQR
jgi:hypothetical protein